MISPLNCNFIYALIEDPQERFSLPNYLKFYFAAIINISGAFRTVSGFKGSVSLLKWFAVDFSLCSTERRFANELYCFVVRLHNVHDNGKPRRNVPLHEN